MKRAETTLDHVKSRSRHPELRYALTNLRPSCGPCNVMKGSLDLDELANKG
jgi:5-methylcytosine-specific restriction endonuclease McrA